MELKVLIDMDHPPLEVFAFRMGGCERMVDVRVQFTDEPGTPA